MLGTLYKIGGVHFRLPGTNGFHIKAENEIFAELDSQFKADRLQMIVVAKKYICVATVHQ